MLLQKRTIDYGDLHDLYRLVGTRHVNVDLDYLRRLTDGWKPTRRGKHEVEYRFEKVEEGCKAQPKLKGWRFASYWELFTLVPRTLLERVRSGETASFDDPDELALRELFGRVPAFLSSAHAEKTWLGTHPVNVYRSRDAWRVNHSAFGLTGWWVYVRHKKLNGG